MKYSCDMIEDLLPLYHDGVCSKGSRRMVEEHFAECDRCKELMDKMRDHFCDDQILAEKESVIVHYKQRIQQKIMLVTLGIIAITILTCFIVNLSVSHTLNWFFIVVASMAVFSSVTALPLGIRRKKRLWTFAGFLASLELLLLVTSLYTHGSWFFLAFVGTLFGVSVAFFPFVINQLPLQGITRNKSLFIMTLDTGLLYLLIITCGIYTNTPDYWRNALLITTINVAVVWVLYTVIRFVKLNGLMKAGICVFAGGIYISFLNSIIDWLIEGEFRTGFLQADFALWNTGERIDANVFFLILITSCLVGIGLFAGGLVRAKKK